MITHELNKEELANLLVDTLYEDAVLTDVGEFVSLRSPSTMTQAYIWTTPHTVVGLTKERYDSLMLYADSYTPVIIVGTPEGIYEFNMDVLKVEWELYSDGDKPDIMVTDLALSTGKHILPFYPEFSSEEEYLDTLMSDAPGDDW